jgi:hypothetical protein
MENQRLETTIDREIQARQQAEKQLREVKLELTEKNELGFDWSFH